MQPLLQRIAPRRVAIVRPSRIGDFICATPAFRALRAALPGAEISLIALPFVQELVARSPHLDRFSAFPGWPGIADQFFDARRALQFLATMQAQRLDLAIQLNGSGVYANPFTLLLGARYSAGFIRSGEPAGRLDAAVPLPEEGREPLRWLALPLHLGAPPSGEDVEFPLWQEDRAAAARLLAAAQRPLIGLHAGSRELGKCWPIERYAALGRALWERHDGTLVLIGGSDEAEAGQRLAAMAGAPALNLVGATSLPVLGGIVEQLDLLVTNDSGPAHIAYALDRPCVTLFATTDPARWGPPARQHQRIVSAPGGIGDQHDERHILGIRLEAVLHAALEALEAGRRKHDHDPS